MKAAGEQDGAMVIDSQTLMLAAANFFVTSIGKGDRKGGGGRHRMASAVSQQARGCFVVKASEGSCGTAANPPAAKATFDVFCNRKIPEKVLIMQGAVAAENEADQGVGELKERCAALEAEKATMAAETAVMAAKIAELEGRL